MQRIRLVIYALLIILLTTIHSKSLYLGVFSILVLLDIRFFIKKIRFVLASILVFNLIVTISYAVMTFFTSSVDWEYIVLINLRVLTITYTTFYFIGHTNLFEALSFSKTLSFLLTITYSQIINFMKVMTDIRDAQISRQILRSKKNYRMFSSHIVALFFTKSIYNAKETSCAMRARGVIDG
jgi:cobalt/nickel transport system permease protein